MSHPTLSKECLFKPFVFSNWILYLFLLAGRLFMSGREVEVEGPKERGDLCSYR